VLEHKAERALRVPTVSETGQTYQRSQENGRQVLAKLNDFRAACIPRDLQKMYGSGTLELKIENLSRGRKAVDR